MAKDKVGRTVHRDPAEQGLTARRRSLPCIASLLGVLVLPAVGLFSASAASAASAGGAGGAAAAGSRVLARIESARAPTAPDQSGRCRPPRYPALSCSSS